MTEVQITSVDYNTEPPSTVDKNVKLNLPQRAVVFKNVCLWNADVYTISPSKQN